MELLRRRSKAHRFHHHSIMGNGQSLGPLVLDHRSARQYQGGTQNCPSQKSGPLERLDGIAQNNCIASQNDAVVGSLYHHIEIRQELRNFDRGRIRDEYNILMPHLEVCCQEIATRIPEAYAENNRNEFTAKLGDVHTEQLGDFAGLEAIEEHRPRISLHIHEPAGFSDRFSKIDPPSVKVELTLLTSRTECQELLLLSVDVDAVAGLHEDIVRWLVDEIGKRHGRAARTALQHHPRFEALPFDTASACDCICNAIKRARIRRGITCRRIDFAKYADQ